MYRIMPDFDRGGNHSTSRKISMAAAKIALYLLRTGQTINKFIPSGLDLFTSSIMYSFSAAYATSNYSNLDIVKISRLSYRMWIIKFASEVFKAVSEPLCNYLERV
ncbi:hypothetical protein F-VV10_0337 [Faustovirus]|nr:hypothetical protein F-VV10_0337 [Faustovirus]